ncbi:GDSL-type esterase/lipase family protein [Phenylobacterium sp.]|uniref:GDSL-type esterase/lipase family protein n=1 Tax=Phenylobacterium sp. TaxID=1871053 RepID=UPI002898DDFD|nr:GDSL-type esterase/lipase family protein [Phenylobacterium sp.]
MRSLIVALGLLAGVAGAAQAQPVGMVADPCPPLAAPDPLGVEIAQAMVADVPFPPALLAKAMDPARGAAAEKAKAEKAASDWADLCRYRPENAAAQGVETVFMGDSITELWMVADPGFFSAARVDRGISGQTSAQMLLRFMPDVVALRPKVVHILAGTNDVAGNTGPNRPEDFKNNISAMADIADANRIAVVIGAIPPADRFLWRGELKPAAQIVELNAWLKAFAAARGYAFADYHAAMATPAGAMAPAFSKDFVHPNRAGYAVMRQVAEQALDEARRRGPRRASGGTRP